VYLVVEMDTLFIQHLMLLVEIYAKTVANLVQLVLDLVVMHAQVVIKLHSY